MPISLSRPLLVALIGLPVLAVAWWFAADSVSAAYNDFLAFVFGQQRAFHTSMTQSLSAFADQAGVSTASAIVWGSFLYGVFHAAGPGHGKMILSTYLLTQPEKVGKSVWLAIASALMQGVVAIVLVYGLFAVFGLVARDTKIAVTWSERLAFALVIGVGLMLIWRGVKGFGWFKSKAAHAHHHHSDHDDDHHAHDHHHHHDHNHQHVHGHDHDHSHDHAHHHAAGEVCETCGHAHMPDAEQLEKATDWRSALGVVLSIGLRPCSGAVLVLVFAKFAQIPLAGVMAVFAISIGTAITVAALAFMSVKARDASMKLLGVGGGSLSVATNGLALLGGAVLILLGYGLMAATFDAPVRSMGL